MLTSQIHNEALVAAQEATEKFMDKHPDFMGACGFAWVTAYVKGNTKLGKSFINLGFEKSYSGGYQIWNPGGSNSQNIDLKEAGADAYVQVIRKYLPEVKIYSHSRMD
mgnify:FL=1